MLVSPSNIFWLDLVGGFNPSETYEFVSWDDGIANMMEQIKVMFQTTNQIVINHN